MRSKKLVRHKSNSKQLNKFRKSQKLNKKSKSLRQKNRKTIKGKRSRSIKRKTMRGGSEQMQLQLQMQKQIATQMQRFEQKLRILQSAITTIEAQEDLSPITSESRETLLQQLKDFFNDVYKIYEPRKGEIPEEQMQQVSKLDELVRIHRFPLIRYGNKVGKNIGNTLSLPIKATERVLQRKGKCFFTLDLAYLEQSDLNQKIHIKQGVDNFFKVREGHSHSGRSTIKSILKIIDSQESSSEGSGDVKAADDSGAGLLTDSDTGVTELVKTEIRPNTDFDDFIDTDDSTGLLSADPLEEYSDLR